MSSGTTPTLSPFVSGTTNTAQAFFLQGEVRRAIPDTETLNFMLAGQSVRVLSDAELAAIPAGAALPSRKDGTLMTQDFAAPPPSVTYYLMTAGQRRRVPDIATAVILTKSSPVVKVELADLTAIPEGTALPTRADNTLYRGTAEAFAYIMSGGDKRAFPDATTLRDAGHDFSALLPISDVDAALIPSGAAFPSSSHFLKPPNADVPLLLMPVRLETRFQGTELWLRFYPDDVHNNGFEPQLTADEAAARTTYLQQAKAGGDSASSAFADLARRYGPARAAWISSANVPTGTKTAQWTIAPYTNVLPERWIVLGYTAVAGRQLLAVGPAIRDPLQLGPSPTSAGPMSDDGMKWSTDFTTAIADGMAFRIPLTTAQLAGFDSIVVLGLKSGLGPQDSAARLADLIEAHHYTDGVELLALNTPTNNTDDVSAGFSASQTNYDQVFAVEQGPSLCPSRATADGDRLAAALNIPPATLSHVKGADGNQDEIANAMNTILWPATWGYYLSQMVNGSVPNPSVILPAARDHFVAAVRARGHFPILRIGKQPYGVLPVCWSAAWKPLENGPLEAPLAGLLAGLRTTWEDSLTNVPRLPGSSDPEASLVSILGMTSSNSSLSARNVIGPEYNFSYWNFVQKDLAATWWSAQSQKALADAGTFSASIANTRLASVTYANDPRILADLLVAPSPLNGQPAPSYIAQLAALGWQALRDVPLPAPIPLLFLLLRHAALRQYMDSAFELLAAAAAATPAEGIEAELLGFSTVVRPTAWDILNRTLPGHGVVGIFLDGARSNATVPDFAPFWKVFNQLSSYSAADLDAAARESLDLASFRLDGWITSLAYLRLEAQRQSIPNGGIVIGAYGWVENVHPQQQQVSPGGFVHAPSLNQATTAAVLRAGYLAHSDASPRPFEIDLSSDKVRLGLHLIEGVREGQTLGALLGYRLERTLHDLSLDQYIEPLRLIAPIGTVVNPLDVVDGLSLLQKFQAGASFWTAPGLPASGTADQQGLAGAISRLEDAVDAVADLTLAESVHQLVRGNLTRAGATLDSIARGDTPPAEIELIETPRSGTAQTYRLVANAAGTAPAGWNATPRAQAEPRLNAWAGNLLGEPSAVRIRVQFLDAARKPLTTKELGLDALALAPLDLLSLPEADGIPQELEGRIRRVVWPTAPSGAAQVRVLTERDPAWTPQVIGLPEWLIVLQSLARVVNGARPLAAADLVPQGDAPGAINTTDVQSRADTAESQMRAALASLQSATANDATLMSAAAFGVTGAIPSSEATQWPAQIQSAMADLSARAAQLQKLASAFTGTSGADAAAIQKARASAAQQQLSDYDSSRLQVIFGAAFQVLPLLTSKTGDLWAGSQTLQANDSLQSVRWFQRVARVRPGAALLDNSVMLAEVLSGQLLLHLSVAQLPVVSGDKWIALSGSTSSSRLSLVAFSPTPVASGTTVAGLMIDEWTEVVPSNQQITGVSFQYADPVSRAPQAMLLAVRPDNFPEWTLESVEGSVLEALDLAKLRAVDPDSLSALGHYLPALYFAYNTGAPAVETVSIDFNKVMKFAAENA